MEFSEFEQKFERFSKAAADQFRASVKLLKKHRSDEELNNWAQEGMEIAKSSFRGWEATGEYFKATPKVLDYLKFPELISWSHLGKALCQDSSAVAAAYFRVSPQALSHLSPAQLGDWAKLGQSLYHGNWRSSSLACKFFEDSPKLVRWLAQKELKQLVTLINSLTKETYDLAGECLDSATEAFPGIQAEERKHFISLGSAMAKISSKDAWGYFQSSPKALSRINSGLRGKFLSMAERIAKQKPTDALTFITDVSQALGEVNQELHAELLERFEELKVKSLTAAIEFLKSCPSVLSRINSRDLGEWLGAGTTILGRNEDEGIAYFQLKSDRGEAIITKLAPGAELASFKETLHRYCKALTGKDIEIISEQDTLEKTISWTLMERLSPEGTIIYLPSNVKRYPTKEENFAWYKVMVTQQTGHLEFGTRDFSFDKPAKLFDDMRSRLPQPTEPEEEDEEPPATDLERFFNSFSNRKLAAAIFNAVEDGRVDFILKHEYKGLKDTYERIQRDELQRRRPLHVLRLREALVWLLVDLTLEDVQNIPVPEVAVSQLQAMAQIVQKMQNTEATVEDSVEATIRLYSIVSQAPNQIFPVEAWQATEVTSRPEGMAKESVTLPTEPFTGELEETSQEELQGNPSETMQIQVSLKDLADGKFPAGFIYPVYYESSDIEAADSEGWEAPPLEEPEQTYFYDEWDFAAGTYRPKWCTVKERTLDEGDEDFVEKTLNSYPLLANHIRNQFQVLELGHLRKVRKLPNGEGFDLDDAIQAVVDRKAGSTPSEKLYWRKQKIERDVCVALLLDMSASTAEPIGESEEPSATDPLLAKMPKRIIDVAKESIALLIGALETIGDKYGIYGFSSYGRDNINFSIVKEIDEALSPQVGMRIDRISPLHATRMGPAIRHATSKLEKRDAKTRILLLISDGRPRDLEYGKGHHDKEYAIHDTKMAFLEAKRKDIAPFCLTVDKEGHDYMRDMMSGDMGYEVVDNIKLLPERLPLLYRRLSG